MNDTRKKLIIINGTMGVGKTKTAKYLFEKLENSAWIDGDWCWTMNPFIPNGENRDMVINNIGFLLRSFLKNSNIQYIVFSWVIHLNEIYELILNQIDGINCKVYKITLLCEKEELLERLHRDIENGKRNIESIEHSIERIEMYKKLDSVKIDTTKKTVNEVVSEILEIVI